MLTMMDNTPLVIVETIGDALVFKGMSWPLAADHTDTGMDGDWDKCQFGRPSLLLGQYFRLLKNVEEAIGILILVRRAFKVKKKYSFLQVEKH
jgi:hypothetical protein